MRADLVLSAALAVAVIAVAATADARGRAVYRLKQTMREAASPQPPRVTIVPVRVDNPPVPFDRQPYEQRVFDERWGGLFWEGE